MENKNIAVACQQMASTHSSACFVFLRQGAKKAKKAQRPLKKQMSSPNIQRKEKPEKVRQLLLVLSCHSYCNTTRWVALFLYFIHFTLIPCFGSCMFLIVLNITVNIFSIWLCILSVAVQGQHTFHVSTNKRLLVFLFLQYEINVGGCWCSALIWLWFFIQICNIII